MKAKDPLRIAAKVLREEEADAAAALNEEENARVAAFNRYAPHGATKMTARRWLAIKNGHITNATPLERAAVAATGMAKLREGQ